MRTYKSGIIGTIPIAPFREQLVHERLAKRSKERLWKDFLSSRENLRRRFQIEWKYRHLLPYTMIRMKATFKRLKAFTWEQYQVDRCRPKDTE